MIAKVERMMTPIAMRVMRPASVVVNQVQGVMEPELIIN
jgi:hypothetical protein